MVIFHSFWYVYQRVTAFCLSLLFVRKHLDCTRASVELDFLHCLAWLPGGSWALVMSSQTWGAIISILQDDVENPIIDINKPTPNHIKLHVSSRALQHHSKNIPRIHDMTWHDMIITLHKTRWTFPELFFCNLQGLLKHWSFVRGFVCHKSAANVWMWPQQGRFVSMNSAKLQRSEIRDLQSQSPKWQKSRHFERCLLSLW